MKSKELQIVRKVIHVDGVNIPKFKYKDINQDFVRVYYSTFAILAGLNPCSRDLMDYLLETMNDDNMVMSNEYSRDNFLEELKQNTMQPDGTFIEYSDSNIKKAYQLLTERRCLIKIKRGVYKVNPEYYFKKSEVKRLASIKLLLEFECGIRDSSMQLLYGLREEECK